MTRKRCFAIFLPIVIVLVALDRVTKLCASQSLVLGGNGIDLGPVDLVLVHNKGAAFGIGDGNGHVFVLIAALVVICVLLWLIFGKEHHPSEVIAISLVAAGAIGNGIDRVTGDFVVDFIKVTFINFPVFNVADVCITIGILAFFVAILFSNRRK